MNTLEQHNEEVVEKFSDKIHEVWSHWQKYLMDRLDFSSGKFVMSEDDFNRWNEQAHTPYSNLSEKEKDSDRKIFHDFYSDFIQSQNKQLYIKIAEGEIERLLELDSNPYPFSVNPDKPMSHIYKNIGFTKSLESQLTRWQNILTELKK